LEALVPDTITVASVQQYKANVELLLQQKTSLLRDKVSTGTHVGKAASVVEQFGEATAQVVTTRHGDTPLLDLAQDKRWVHPIDVEWGSLIDREDQLRAIIELTSPYATAAAAAMNRKVDDIILAAIFSTNFKGENGTTAETFDTTNYQVGVNTGGTASSINVAKLQAAIRMLITANKGELMEAVYSAIGAYEHDALLKEIQVVNKDYGNSAVLVDGKVKRFMGVDFTLSERLTITSGNRLVPIWLKSGMYLGVWADIVAEIAKRADKRFAVQVYTCMTVGATRTQSGKQIQVLCDDQI
jgi:endo-1,4-beta-mannosidase